MPLMLLPRACKAMHQLVTLVDTLLYAAELATSALIAVTAWVAVDVFYYLLYFLIKVPGIIECQAFLFKMMTDER